jgi:hypothetical protein
MYLIGYFIVIIGLIITSIGYDRAVNYAKHNITLEKDSIINYRYINDRGENVEKKFTLEEYHRTLKNGAKYLSDK